MQHGLCYGCSEFDFLPSEKLPLEVASWWLQTLTKGTERSFPERL